MKRFIKRFSWVLPVLTLALLLCVSAFAAEKTVYMNYGSSGDGSAPDNAVGTFSSAFSALGNEDGTIVLCNAWSFNGALILPQLKSNVTIAAQNGGKLILVKNSAVTSGSGEYTLTLDLPVEVSAETLNFYGRFNSITFGENFSVSGGAFYFYGGLNATNGSATHDKVVCTHPYTLTVYAGNFAGFVGGNYRGGSDKGMAALMGSIAAPITVNIHGGEFGKAGEYPFGSNNKEYDAFSLSGMSLLADDATLNITGGTFHSPIYAQGRTGPISSASSIASITTMSDPIYYALDGDVEIRIAGGTFTGGSIGAYYTQAAYTTVMRGNYTLDITGGEFADGTVLDATQVKAYPGENKAATLNLSPNLGTFTPIRFDQINGEAQMYEEPLRIAFVGDSITEGHTSGDIQFNSYSAQFLARCEAEGKEIVLSNFGVSAAGATHYSGHYYKGTTLGYPMLTEECDADYYFVALGTNDYSAGSYGGSELDFITEYTQLVTTLGNAANTKRVFVSSATHRHSDSAQTLNVASVVRPLQERIAKELNAKDAGKYTFVDLYGLTRTAALGGEMLSSDNIHPTAAGYGIMAEAVYGAVFHGVTEPAVPYRRTDVWLSAAGSTDGDGSKENPTSWLSQAMSMLAPGEACTLHVVGNYTYDNGNISLSVAPAKLTIVGEGDGATLALGDLGTFFWLGSDTEVQNLTFSYTKNAPHFYAKYHSVTMDETVAFSPNWSFYAGKSVFADNPDNRVYETPEGASSDNDCTLLLNCRADFVNFMLGNRRTQPAAPLGTYSGNMTADIGANVTVGASGYYYIGVVGHNYNAGNLDVTIENWKDGAPLSEYAGHGSISGVTYVPSKNSGTVTLHTGAGVTGGIVVAGDFDGDGTLTFADALTSIRYMLDGFDPAKTDYFYGESRIMLADVLCLLRRIAK